jgi:hypothetical protein
VKQPKKKASRVNKKQVTDKEKKETIESAGLEIVSLAKAQELKENYLASLKKIELDQKNKSVIKIKDAENIMIAMVMLARSKILAIKGIMGPLLKEFVTDPENFKLCMGALDKHLDNILIDLARSEVSYSQKDN